MKKARRHTQPSSKVDSTTTAPRVASVTNLDLAESSTGPQTDDAESAQAYRRFVYRLAVIAFIGLFFRVIHTLQSSVIPTASTPAGDSAAYYEWALRIANGDWLGDQAFYQAPLYPYWLAVVMKAVGSQILVLRLVQAIMGALSVVLLGHAIRIFFDDRSGLIGAGMLAIYAPAVFYDGIIQKATLDSLLVCLLLLLLASYVRGRPVAFATGITLGLLTLTRENALLWIPLPAVWMLVSTPRGTYRSSAKKAATYLAGVATVLLPVAGRNAYLSGEWSPTTFQAGPNFYIGNHQGANGLYQPLVPGHETPMYERADATRLAEQAVGRSLSPREVSKYWFSQALADMTADRWGWIKLLAIKTALVVNQYEVPDVESLHIYASMSPVLKVLGYVGNFGILFPLTMLGVYATRAEFRKLWLLHLMSLTMVAAIALFFVLGRYRFPLVPLLIVFAAPALCQILDRLRNPFRRVAAVPMLVSIAGIMLAWAPLTDRNMLEASSLMNQGAAAGQRGDLPASISWLEQAIQMEPSLPEAYFNLGRALALSGRHREAINAFVYAKELAPNMGMIDLQMGGSLESLGLIDQAVEHFRKAMENEPHDVRAAQALRRLGYTP